MNLKKILLFLFIGLLLQSCKTDKPKKNSQEIEFSNHDISDSIFGLLSAKDQYAQHFIIEIPAAYQDKIPALKTWLIDCKPGGLKFVNWQNDSIKKLKLDLDTLLPITPFYTAEFFDVLNSDPYPFWDVNKANLNLDLIKPFNNIGYNLIEFAGNLNWSDQGEEWLKKWQSLNGSSFIQANYSDQNFESDYPEFIKSLQKVKNGIKINLTYIDSVVFNQFRDLYDFEGLFIVHPKDKMKQWLLRNGADLITVTLDTALTDVLSFNNWQLREEDFNEYEKSTRRILEKKLSIIYDTISHDSNKELEYSSLNFKLNSTSLLNNKNKLVAISKKTTVYHADEISINSRIRSENNIQFKRVILDSIFLKKLNQFKDPNVLIIPTDLSAALLGYIKDSVNTKNSLVCFADPKQYQYLSNQKNLVFTSDLEFEYLVQQFAARLPLKGDFSLNDTVIKGLSIKKKYLARTSPDFVGVNADTLKRIDFTVQSALNGRAFPGCQVLIAKNGCIIYDKSFGYHSYDRVRKVNSESLYDLASLTKVIATTMVAMRLYELGTFKLQDSLSKFLPDSLKDHLQFPSTIRNITFSELLTHKSGMPAGFPILRYMQYVKDSVKRFDKYFCDQPSEFFNVEVAENFYLENEYLDSMWLTLNQIWLDPDKPYKYSDVNMNTLYVLFKSMLDKNPEKFDLKAKETTANNFDKFLLNYYFKPLSMDHTRYMPRKEFAKEKIVPTETDNYWRKQTLRGHVHDPNAALLGGVAGNAGLFSTTNDLAIICELIRQKGMYGGRQYLAAETVNKFIATQPNSHRGLGFNKPSINVSAFGCSGDASPATIGHTGFTGTCFWIDPENGLTFIFLSNRVTPKVNNRIYQYGVRKKIHQIAYDACYVD
ncbi:serine hydrolase domain-containing protein [Crocinitomix catalasitica]|uniref:serine hydrolase domain-containing protein n=1 Tax=Crocinitomix catalasitica TaxID=184607 RepID=UPI0012F70E6F|nr:serine hydrolase [Crocinitomix catalasitica]